VHNVLDTFNTTTPNLNFTLEEEVDNKINFLDITITKNNSLNFDIYWKPSFKDTINPNDAYHPREHKLAAIRYLSNRMKTYNLKPTSTQMEYDKLKQILYNNKYDVSILHKVGKTNNKEREQDVQRKKWAKFTYVGKETRLITKAFKNTDVKIKFITNNNIERLLSTYCNQNQNKYDKCGIYQLTCPSCNKKYIGQTGGFALGFKSTFETTNTWKINRNSHNIF
jgi:hypothetical protein